MTLKYSKPYISNHQIFSVSIYSPQKKRDSFLRLRGFQALIFIYAASLQIFPALWQSEHH